MGRVEDFITVKQVSTATNTLTRFSEENARRFDHIFRPSCFVRNPTGGGEILTKLFETTK